MAIDSLGWLSGYGLIVWIFCYFAISCAHVTNTEKGLKTSIHAFPITASPVLSVVGVAGPCSSGLPPWTSCQFTHRKKGQYSHLKTVVLNKNCEWTQWDHILQLADALWSDRSRCVKGWFSFLMVLKQMQPHLKLKHINWFFPASPRSQIHPPPPCCLSILWQPHSAT